MIEEGFVLGDGEGTAPRRTSPLLRPWDDLDIKDRKHLRDKAALGILALERIGCSVNRFAEDGAMDVLTKSVLAVDLAKKRYEDLQIDGNNAGVPFVDADPRERSRMIEEARELLEAVDAVGAGVKIDGRTEDVRRLELYYAWARDSVGKENAVQAAVNYGISRGTSFDDINVFIDVVNRNEGCEVAHCNPVEVALSEYMVAKSAYGLSFKGGEYENIVTAMPSCLSYPFNAKTQQAKLGPFLEKELEAVRAATRTMASRIAEIGHDQVRAIATTKAIEGDTDTRRENERQLLGYDLGLKSAYDRFITTETRYAASMEAERKYMEAPAMRRLFMRKPDAEVTEVQRVEAKKNLESVLADRIAMDGNKSLRRIDFDDASSVKTTVRANNFLAGDPTVELELTIYDGHTAWHQGYAISKEGRISEFPIAPHLRDITVEQRYLAADRRPEMIQAQYSFDKVADMVRCAALEPYRLESEKEKELAMDTAAFRKQVENEAGKLKEERLQGGDILDKVMARKTEQEPEISDELLTAYVEDRATADERKAVEKALEGDPQLRETLDVIRKADGINKEAPETHGSETKEAPEKEVDHPEIYTHLPGEITPRDYDMLIAYGVSSKDIKRLGIDKKVSINQDVFVREKRPWDTTPPATRSVYINLSLTSDNRVKVSDPISGKDLGEAWQVLSSGKNLNFLQIHKDAEINRNNEQHVTTTVKLK